MQIGKDGGGNDRAGEHREDVAPDAALDPLRIDERRCLVFACNAARIVGVARRRVVDIARISVAFFTHCQSGEF